MAMGDLGTRDSPTRQRSNVDVDPTPSGRRADIQGLRALAVLMVVAFHAGLDVPGGFTGVDVFFVISGFVITAMLLREAKGTGRFSLRAFYARRVRRIMPASAMTISVVALLALGAINPATQTITARTGIAGSLFTANIVLARAPGGYFAVAATNNPLLHIWTLSVEEQFYFVFPVAILLGLFLSGARRRRESVGVLAALITFIAVVSFGIGWYASTHIVRTPGFASAARFAFFTAPARAWEFAVGALLALAAPHLRRLTETTAHVLAAFGLALVVFGAFAIDGTTPFPGTAALIPVGGTALLIMGGTATRRGIPGLFSQRPLTAIGDFSYSWYLWHWPLIVFCVALFPMEGSAALMGALLSIIPAWLSFRFLETRFRHDHRIRSGRAVAVGTICVAVPIVACLVLLKAPKPSASASTRALLQSTFRAHGTEARGCNRGVPYASLPPQCTWKVAGSRGSIVLIGDSNAGQFTEPAAGAANRLGYDLTVATYPNCPLADVRISLPSAPEHEGVCLRFVETSMRQLARDRPKLVILGASVPLLLKSHTTFRDPSGRRVATSPDTKATLWSEGLQRVLRKLHAAGIPTIFIHTVPQWEAWDPRVCANVRVYFAPRTCGTNQTLAEVERFRDRALAADRRALRAAPATVAVDFLHDLCRADCATNRDDFWIYKDGRHLSVAGALGLTDHFERLVRTNARS